MARLAVTAALILGAACALAPETTRGLEASETSAQRHVPILMYHVLADPDPTTPHPGLFVGHAEFQAQLRWLERHGYRAITLRAVWKHWQGGRALPSGPSC